MGARRDVHCCASITIFLVWRGWFSRGPVGANSSTANPLAVHTADSVLRILQHDIQLLKQKAIYPALMSLNVGNKSTNLSLWM